MASTVACSPTRPTVRSGRTPRGWSPALLELLLVAVLYLVYSGSRVLANDDVHPALARARDITQLERVLGLGWERAVNGFFVAHDWVGVAGSYWYATAHYVVTAAVLVWLYRRGRDVYAPARAALAVATVLGLACYLVLPTAPPRMLGGFVDVLHLHADAGWWGGDASAPRGLGGLTNQLAAFPSLHAGWSLWVALAVLSATSNRALRAAAVAHAAITAAVVVGTGNHWTVDVLVGWLVVGAAWLVVRRTRTATTRVPLSG